MSLQLFVQKSAITLMIWALKTQVRPPRGVSWHAAALLYRGKLVIDSKTGHIIASVNNNVVCAERQLILSSRKKSRIIRTS